MRINVYKGKPGREQLLYYNIGDTKDYIIPNKNELICLGNRSVNQDEVYKILDVLYDYSYSDSDFPEIDIFVEEYNWED